MRKQEKWNPSLDVYWSWTCARKTILLPAYTEVISTRMVVHCFLGVMFSILLPLLHWGPLGEQKPRLPFPLPLQSVGQCNAWRGHLVCFLFCPWCLFMQSHAYCWGLSLWTLESQRTGTWWRVPPSSYLCATPGSPTTDPSSCNCYVSHCEK